MKRKGVERVLEGWSVSKSGPVSLEELDSLRSVWRKKIVVEQVCYSCVHGAETNSKYSILKDAPDPTKDLTFNLSLTDSQQTSRSQVPLPYEHDGTYHVIPNNSVLNVRVGRAPPTQNQSAQIYYDPDSADDLDDEDPDEDLDL